MWICIKLGYVFQNKESIVRFLQKHFHPANAVEKVYEWEDIVVYRIDHEGSVDVIQFEKFQLFTT